MRGVETFNHCREGIMERERHFITGAELFLIVVLSAFIGAAGLACWNLYKQNQAMEETHGGKARIQDIRAAGDR
jgi:hypothetical protein